MEEEALIKFDKVNKKFGSNIVLNNLDIEIKKEGIFGIMGLSGSGKTTLLNILIGFWKPDSGKVLFDGQEIHRNKKTFNQVFGFGTQAGSVYPKLTIKENMIYFGKMYNMRKKDIKARMKELLEFVELENSEDVIAEELSTGMYRRLDIACSLIHKPKVLILDEPTGNMDPVLRKKILALIKKIDDEGTKVIITSHLMGEAEAICDELAILHKGKVIAQDHPNVLKNKYSRNEEIRFETETREYESIIPSIKRMNVTKLYEIHNQVYLYTPDAQKTLASLMRLLKAKKQRLIQIEVTKPRIEEVFEYLTRK
ncbi:MAG: ABC transporter ATP-binding protein [archaeon]